MIDFVPGYDEATQANLRVAAAFLPGGALTEHAAARERLLARLRDSDDPVFSMAHGERDALLGQSGERALVAEDFASYAPRIVYAYACHTATSLGARAAADGWAWAGYTGPVAAPGKADAEHAALAGVFRVVREGLGNIATGHGTGAWLAAVRDGADAAAEALDALEGASLLAYVCANNLWTRLRVWRPGDAAPRRHPLAGEPMLVP